MNKKITLRLGIILTLFTLIVAGCTDSEIIQSDADEHDGLNHELSAEDKMMIEHCKEMPEMDGCEHYLEHGLLEEGICDLDDLENGGCPFGESDMDESSMPCHQMPDGSWMGDCDGSEMMEHVSEFLPGSDIKQSALYKAKSTSIVDVSAGDVVELSADMVVKEIKGRKLTMYGYNGEIPGPIFRGEKGTSFTVEFTNNIDWDTTVHWHGLRHDNKDDGVPDVTQPPTKPGESYTYTVRFPDEGMYWYHPHIREDLQQDAGLAGNLWVIPNDGEYFNDVHLEEVLMLDDILLDQSGLEGYGEEHGTFSLMGRYGNVLLVNGETSYDLEVDSGSVVRFYITNVANARPFNLSFGGAKMKLIGSDLGKYEREEFVDSVVIAPAERYIIEVYFEERGSYLMQHIHPDKTYTLGEIAVRSEPVSKDLSEVFSTLRVNDEIVSDVARFESEFDRKPDYEIDLTIEMKGMMANMDHAAMGHGMMHGEDEEPAPIEWEDDMNMMNARSNSENIDWILKDKASGKENMDLMITAKKDSVMKLRFFNDPDSDHPMQHPIHLHGQRFLVTHIDDELVSNKVWKDTVLVRTGETVDILVDVTNPGEWMMHCHIAEHLEAGMMSGFVVE